ncbi:MAG: FtsX-like permease family protein [Pseudomonadota bacterium]
MKDFFVLARRNVLRNARRSLLTVLTIVIGLTFIFIIHGFLNGLQREIKEGVTKAELGEIQIVRKGFRQALPTKANDYLFSYNDELKKLVQSTAHVTGVTGRLLLSGLLNHQASQSTTPMLGIGIDPEMENQVCPRLALLVKAGGGGAFLQSNLEKSAKLAGNLAANIEDAPVDANQDYTKPVPQASAVDLPTTQQEFHQLLIGEYMRRGFTTTTANGERQAAVGDEIILMVQDVNSSQRSMVTKLSGVLDVTNPTANKTTAYLVLATAQQLVGAPGKVTQLVLSLDNTERRFEVAKALNEKLAPYGLVAEPWDEINKFFVTIMGLQNAMFSMVTTVIIIFVLVAIIITTLMSVSERTREIGTLMAIGYKRRHIMSLFMLESTMVGAMGGLIGVTFGSALILYLNARGITFQLPGTESPVILHPFNSVQFSVFTAFLGVIAGGVGAFYPARTASKMSPLEAMGHV